MRYTVVLTKEQDGRFSVSVPSLPGCFTWGQTREEAIVHAKEAIQLYMETCSQDGIPIPKEDTPPSVVVEGPEPKLHKKQHA
ncbi:MAG: type II toxin-antitoxin system HicB family antitoxin [Dehalococcoidia bacterium]|nr:type II toxin-antitoxin system HicB family antitoxin [Dehalococcoidia bacterium]